MKYGDVHDVYDVILKIIIHVWASLFLHFIGIDEEVKEILKTEFITRYGKKVYVDFLCKLKNGDLFHIYYDDSFFICVYASPNPSETGT